MPYAQVNGQTLYYEDSGGDKPAIVFSHGLLMDHEMFAPQVEALRDRYRCIVWDERAHGDTAGDDIQPFDYYDSANDLAALLDDLNLDQAVLAGMSQGGFVSLRCALTHPQRVRALILIDTQAGTEDPELLPQYKQMVESWAEHGLADEVAETIAQIILGQNMAGAEAWKAKWRAWRRPHLMAAFQALVERDDISAELARIDVPALVIHGEADQAIALERAEDMAERLPDSQIVTVPGAGHAANLTHPQPVNAAIEDFLNRYAGG